MIIVVGGGTGGHLFPAIAIVEKLNALKYKAMLITDTRCKSYLKDNMQFPIRIIHLGSLNKSKILTLIRISIEIIKTLFFFLRNKPKLVIGFGSYISYPILFAAKLLKIKIVLHEQNCILGKVNRLFLPYSKALLLNFADTTNISINYKDKIFTIGNPIRNEISNIKVNKKTFSNSNFTILVIGGSQGASVFSKLVPNAIKNIKLDNIKIKIFHQAPSQDHEKIQNAYKALNIDYEISEFFTDIPNKYLNSHLAICRAGASTITELIHFGLPAILIPLPNSAGDHQLYNAKYLNSQCNCWYFEESSLVQQTLYLTILEIINNIKLLGQISEKLLSIKKDSAKLFVDIVEKIY